MKRFAFILLCATASTVYTEKRWVEILTFGPMAIELDRKSFVYSRGIRTVWVRYRIKTSSLIVGLFRNNYDCSDRTVQTILEFQYDENGNTIKENSAPTGYSQIVPGNIQETVLETVCANPS